MNSVSPQQQTRVLRLTQSVLRLPSPGFLPDADCLLAPVQACSRMGQTERALSTYARMRAAPPASPLAPSVHAYVAAMRAACEGGRWKRALDIWDDLKDAGCAPTGRRRA